MSSRRVSGAVSEPLLAPELVERVLAKLGLRDRPSLDLAGLNTAFAAYCGSVPFDNIRKRIWFASDQTAPLPGGDTTDFFENWLRHGTGGTCWPINGGMYALVHALGFGAQRIAGTMVVEGYPGPNHGSVVVTLGCIDYLVDANIGSFKVLPLVPGTTASTGEGIHDIKAVPIGNHFEVLWYSGHDRDKPVPFRTQPEYHPVDHAFFLARYERSKGISPFNESLYISRRFPERIITIGRNNKIIVAADHSMSKTEISDSEQKAALIEELSISEEIVAALPPDIPGHTPLF